VHPNGGDQLRSERPRIAAHPRRGVAPGWRPAAHVDPGNVRLGLLLLLVTVLLGCSSAGTGSRDSGSAKEAEASAATTVVVLGSWEPSELAVLQDVVAPFEARTGYKVVFTITRDLRPVLEASLAADDPPDIAGLPGPGYLATLARAGHLVDLGNVLDPGVYKRDTAPAFVHLGTVDGTLVGAFLKGTVKGLLWFNPAVYADGPFDSWAALQHDAITRHEDVRPWCIGLESDEASGWPGTDWIEDFLLRQSGPQVYDDWVAGRVKWTSPEVRWAFESYGTVVGELDVAGGIQGALNTHFSRAGDGLFTDPPACLFVHQGTFMATFLDEAVRREGGQYAMMPFPDIDPRFSGALVGAGDLIALMRDTPPGRELLEYLLSAEAQKILVSHGGALSGNMTLTDYPDDVLRQQAELLASARIFRFDASDAMPEEMGRAFWQAVLDYTTDQSRLDGILVGLDAVQLRAYATDG
jgi:alpha-glucoside transport system substrate-binding protein